MSEEQKAYFISFAVVIAFLLGFAIGANLDPGWSCYSIHNGDGSVIYQDKFYCMRGKQ